MASPRHCRSDDGTMFAGALLGFETVEGEDLETHGLSKRCNSRYLQRDKETSKYLLPDF